MAKKEKKNKKNKKIDNTSMASELKKVTWPTSGELFKATLAVFSIIFIVVFILFVSDTVFTLGSKKFTNYMKTKQEKLKENENKKTIETDVKVNDKEKDKKEGNKEKKAENKKEEKKENKDKKVNQKKK